MRERDRFGDDGLAPAAQRDKVRVWDGPTRMFHWLLVLAVAVVLVTGFLLPVTWLGLHLGAGSVIAGLVLWRVLWGFTGSTHSRFGNFIYSPSHTWAHVRHLTQRSSAREAGHNPLGALMVFMLLLIMLVLVTSGLGTLGGQFKQGPLKSFLSYAVGGKFREMHEIFAWLLLFLIAFHMVGVGFESWRTRENLARAMVTGDKRAGFLVDLPAQRPRTLLAVALMAVLLAGCGWLVQQMSRLPAFGVPVMLSSAAEQNWRAECSACHMAFHPTLLPAASWARLMTRLDDHFGENASLDAARTQDISTFLQTHAAETSDSLPAHNFRTVAVDRPLEITATAFWTRMHKPLGDAVFQQRSVSAKQNCAACHADAATGLFAPQQISIPQEKK